MRSISDRAATAEDGAARAGRPRAWRRGSAGMGRARHSAAATAIGTVGRLLAARLDRAASGHRPRRAGGMRPNRASSPRPKRRSLVTFQYLHAKFHISPGAAGTRRIIDHRLTVAGGLETATSRGMTVSIDDLAEKVADLRVDLARQLQRVVVHRQHDAAELQLAGLPLHHLANHFDHLRQAFHGEILALDRHQHFGRSWPGPSASSSPTRGAVDEHEIVAAGRGPGVREAGPRGHCRRAVRASTSRKLRLPGKRSSRAVSVGQMACASGMPATSGWLRVGSAAQAAGGVALRVEVDQQGLASGTGQARGQ